MTNPALPPSQPPPSSSPSSPLQPPSPSGADGPLPAGSPDHALRDVLSVPAFRRLWSALSLSSFGDWLGLLALTALAPRLASEGYAAANLAIAGVFILRLAPAIVVGPLAGVVADRLDRRLTMVVCDVARFVLFLSIPLVGTLWWLLVATLLIEVASLFWIPAKEATVPNLVSREQLETANQLSLFTTYGSAPVAALVFAGLALITGIVDNPVPQIAAVDLAIYVNAATFLVSAATILRLTDIPAREPLPEGVAAPTVWHTLVEGWTYIGRSRLVRGLVVGMLGAFAAGGAVIGLARTFVTDLRGGDPGYGLLFGTVFLGLAGGMLLGPRLLPDFSRRRMFGLAIGGAGLSLALLALIPNLVVAVFITLVIGAFTGVAWVTGYTLLGLEVADEVRGRTFAFVQTMTRVVLVAVLAVAPLLAAAVGRHPIEVTEDVTLRYHGAAFVFLAAGLLASALGIASFRQMDDRKGVPLSTDLASAFRSEAMGHRPAAQRHGFFVALEGGEGAGKSTQARALAEWLESMGHEVLVTFEPGATEVGRRLRSVLLDHPSTALPGLGADPLGVTDGGSAGPGSQGPSARTEALLFAADRAEHVATVIRPALALGHVVISDRYTDSSVAYQGAGRELGAAEVARLSRWATDGLSPQLTVLLDLSPGDGLARVTAPDRVESEPLAFHERVREHFLALAHRGRHRYLIVDGTLPPREITAAIRDRLEPMLPPSAQQIREAELARAAEVERRRVAEQVRQLEEARARADAQDRERREAEEAEARLAQAAAEAAAEAERRRAAETEAAVERERQQRLTAEAAARAREEHALIRARQAEERRRDRGAADERPSDRGAADERPSDRGAADERPSDRGADPGGRQDTRPLPMLPRDDSGSDRGARPRGGAPGAEPDRGPETRDVSLVDELFGFDEDESPAERTIQLPRVHRREDT